VSSGTSDPHASALPAPPPDRPNLHADAVRVLSGWPATSQEADLARKRTLELLAVGPAAMTRSHRPGHVTASALVVDAAGRVLLCLHGRLGMWMQLGGHCEPADTSLSAAAFREATEESGISGLILDPEPIDVDVHEVRCTDEAGAVGPSLHFDVRYLLRCPTGAVEQISEESSALAWFAPDDLPTPLASGTARQIPPALSRR
jgi:8-oxo-dGTP pyrophosphatase MutT (NUDIX family)